MLLLITFTAIATAALAWFLVKTLTPQTLKLATMLTKTIMLATLIFFFWPQLQACLSLFPDRLFVDLVSLIPDRLFVDLVPVGLDLLKLYKPLEDLIKSHLSISKVHVNIMVGCGSMLLVLYILRCVWRWIFPVPAPAPVPNEKEKSPLTRYLELQAAMRELELEYGFKK